MHTCSLTHQSCGTERGETIAETIVREVREETGSEATVEKLLGVYSNPRHVSVDDNGEVRQQFSVCILCRAVGGEPRTAKESSEVRFVDLVRPLTTLHLKPVTDSQTLGPSPNCRGETQPQLQRRSAGLRARSRDEVAVRRRAHG